MIIKLLHINFLTLEIKKSTNCFINVSKNFKIIKNYIKVLFHYQGLSSAAFITYSTCYASQFCFQVKGTLWRLCFVLKDGCWFM